MKIIQRNGITVYLDPDEETMDRFNAVARGCRGFLSADARVAKWATAVESRESTEPPTNKDEPSEPSK